LLSTKSQTKTANLLRLSFDQVHRVMQRSVERGMSRRDKSERYYYLSIDEKSVHKGHDYMSILSDEATGIVIEVMEGRSKESVDKLCQDGLSQAPRDDVRAICTDMWEPFIYGSKKYFTNALHCHDNFHLVGYLNKAVDKVRRREVKTQEELKKSKYLFLKDKLNFTENQRLKFEAISRGNYEVSRAWQVKENFRDIQFRQDRAEALSIYAYWRMDAKRTNIKEINDVVEMFDRHQNGIVNAIQTGSNNARAERINGSIQELKTIGRGYRKTENFRIAILFFHGNLDLLSQEIQ
jgi:transposase